MINYFNLLFKMFNINLLYMKQKTISKQSQLIDQNFSNNIMLNAIAALENLAFFYGYDGKRIFDYYSGDANIKNENALINAVIIQLQVFRASHSNFMLNYSEYNFPKNLSKNQIIKILKEWKFYIENKNVEIYYDEIINYLNGNSSHSGIEKEVNEKKKEWGKVTKKDLQQVSNSAPFINTDMFNQMDKVKQSYKKTGDYQINAVLNQSKRNNKLLNDLKEIDQKLKNKTNKCKNNEMQMEKCFQILLQFVSNGEQIFHAYQGKMIECIQLFESSLQGLELEDEYSKGKIIYYNNIIGQIISLNIKDPNYELILNFCKMIVQIYKDNLNICNTFDNK